MTAAEGKETSTILPSKKSASDLEESTNAPPSAHKSRREMLEEWKRGRAANSSSSVTSPVPSVQTPVAKPVRNTSVSSTTSSRSNGSAPNVTPSHNNSAVKKTPRVAQSVLTTPEPASQPSSQTRRSSPKSSIGANSSSKKASTTKKKRISDSKDQDSDQAANLKKSASNDDEKKIKTGDQAPISITMDRSDNSDTDITSTDVTTTEDENVTSDGTSSALFESNIAMSLIQKCCSNPEPDNNCSSLYTSLSSFLFSPQPSPTQEADRRLIDQLQTELAAERGKNSDLKSQIEYYSKTLEEAKNDMYGLLDDIAALQNSLTSTYKQKEDAVEKVRKLEEKLKEAHAFANRCYAVESEMERLRVNSQDEIQKIRVECEKEVEELKFAMKVLKLKHDDTPNDDDANELDNLNEEDPIVARAKLQDKEESIIQLEQKLADADMIRRQMHNKIQELRGNIRVYVRVRPIVHILDCINDDQVVDSGDTAAAENAKAMMNSSPIEVIPGGDTLSILSKKEKLPFNFDKVFEPCCSQQDVFDEISDFVQSAMDGYNVCLFSYGQTGSGKTHTMQGSGIGDMRGIIPRAVEQILSQVQTMQDKWDFSIQASFLEIYNEFLKDLLVDMKDDSSSAALGLVDSQKENQLPTSSSGSKLMIRKDDFGRMYVDGLSSIKIDTKNESRGMEQLNSLMDIASRARSVASTKMNTESSRSHSIFTLDITGTNNENGTTVVGSLNLVDLAGSERLGRSNSNNDPKLLKETQAINRSLSCLGDVFNALASGANHVPYRNSKLTYLLQDCMGGDGKSCMFVNLSPTLESCGESLCSLRFAQRVNQIELGKATKNLQLSRSNKVDK